MPTTATLRLRTDRNIVGEDGDGSVPVLLGRPDDVDLDALTPRARALAEAVAQLPGSRKGAGEILCEHRTLTRRDTTPNPEMWLSPDQMTEPARQTWSAWDRYPQDSPMPATEYLERQARKIPPEWRIVSAWAIGETFAPVPSSARGAADDLLTPRGVVEYLARHHDRHIGAGTWRSYASRGQAPAAVDRVGREGLWSAADVAAWANGEWHASRS